MILEWTPKSRLSNIVTTVMFCLTIFLPLVFGIIQTDKKVSTAEKRTLATMPQIPTSAQEIQTYPRQMETYYADHFGLRDWLITLYKTLKYKIGDPTSENITIGKDGWLFLGNIKDNYTKFNDPFGDVRNKNIYSQSELEAFARNISDLKDWLKNQGIEYVFVIAPSKHTVYFDKLPSYIKKVNPQSATDQLIEHLHASTDVNVLDLRAVLEQGKQKKVLYYKTDSHWNYNGANIAQYEIIKYIEKLFPGQINAERIPLKPGNAWPGDLENMLGVPVEKDENPAPVFPNSCALKSEPAEYKIREPHTWSCPGKNLNALIYRDSFFSALQPFFIRAFERSTYIWEELKYASVETYIAAENPDIVIEEWVERKLPRPYPVAQIEFLNKEKFKQNFQTIYQKNDGNLTYHHLSEINNDTGQLSLTATGHDPMIHFPDLNLMGNSQYVLRIKFNSSIKSYLVVFYSVSTSTGYPFTPENSIKVNVEKGENDFYILLDHSNLGSKIRVDPIATEGKVQIQELEIRQVPQLQ